jgi:hypothetical protein
MNNIRIGRTVSVSKFVLSLLWTHDTFCRVLLNRRLPYALISDKFCWICRFVDTLAVVPAPDFSSCSFTVHSWAMTTARFFHSFPLPLNQAIDLFLCRHHFSLKIITINLSDAINTFGTMLQAGMPRVQFPLRSLDISIDLIFQPHYGHVVDCNRNEYQESSWGRPSRKADKLTAICMRADCLENVGASASHNPMGLDGQLHG